MPDHVYGIIEVESSSMLKKLVIGKERTD